MNSKEIRINSKRAEVLIRLCQDRLDCPQEEYQAEGAALKQLRDHLKVILEKAVPEEDRAILQKYVGFYSLDEIQPDCSEGISLLFRNKRLQEVEVRSPVVYPAFWHGCAHGCCPTEGPSLSLNCLPEEDMPLLEEEVNTLLQARQKSDAARWQQVERLKRVIQNAFTLDEVLAQWPELEGHLPKSFGE
jgi:hypothetical protein